MTKTNTPAHQTVTATDLRDGDLMRLGDSTNYVLIADAQPANGRIALTIYDGTEPNANGPTLHLDPNATVSLSMRGATA